MPSRIALPTTPVPIPGQWGVLPDPGDEELLAWADPDPDERVLLLGPNCLELMCALIRRGNLDAATIRHPDRPDAQCADLVIIANIASVDGLTRAIAHAHRALVPFGSLVIGLPRHVAVARPATITTLLGQSGFERIRRTATMVRAAMPLVGGLRCA